MFLDEIKVVVVVFVGVKFDCDVLWRLSDEDNDARVRRLEALEVYAFGEKFYFVGEKVMVDDLFGKLGFMCLFEGVLKMLILIGMWSRYENLFVRKYGV